MFSNFFIQRPVFSIVAAFIVLLLGVVSIPTLPIAQYPEITPPQVTVTANYTGASAEVVESTITNVLEREINGVEGMRYLSSSSSNSGTSSINVTFAPNRNVDLAAVDVQNRVSTATPRLPEAVQRTGVTVNKESSGFLMAIGIYSENKAYDPLFLSNYLDTYVVDALRRIDGVGNVQIFGQRQYAMRLWLDPQKLAARNLTFDDVVGALNRQNLQVGAGRLGQPPIPSSQEYQIDLRAISRLREPTEFENIVLRTEDNGTLIKLRDVGRAELGAEDYSSILRFRGQDAVGLGISQLPGSNALQVAQAVRSELDNLSKNFPPGIQYETAFDSTAFVEASLEEVLVTLIMAIALVILIIFIFLQDWRTTLIPSITIPASLIGTFIFVRIFGFSINTLTLFGLTLATGMVVDDAIVIVEDITRLINEQGMTPKQASIQAMRELGSAVIATSLVLMAVFVPVAFFPGTTGALYRQFALTIAFSIAVSTFLALTLTPALSALLLRPGQMTGGILGRLFQAFNRGFDWSRERYRRSLGWLMRVKSLVLGLFVVALGLTALLYVRVPGAFLPDEDQGYFITVVQAPEGVSLNYTDKVLRQVERELLQVPEIKATFAVGGFGIAGPTANSGIVFVNLKPWSERRGSGQSVQAITGQLAGKLLSIPEARVFPFNPPAIQGLGTLGGFSFQLQDRSNNDDLNALVATAGKLLGQANQTPGLQQVLTTFAANTPQLEIEVNRDAAEALQVNVDDIFSTLETALGSRYVNDFTLGQRNYRVYVQADQAFRTQPTNLGQLYVRSGQNRMIPISNLVRVTSATSAQTINHFNLFRAIEINGNAAPGYSSGNAIAAMERVAAQVLPRGFSYEWSGTSLEEIESGGQAPLIFGLGLLLVFLVLAAQYENFIDPFVIMLAVPLAILGALLAQSLRGLENDVYCQVGLVMLIGLASKNSILIVEFANQLRQQQGFSLAKAAIEASQERLRPILMTAISTLVGIFPLAIATGAGAGSRQSLGTAVFGGMLIATFLSLFVVPVLYVVVVGLSERVADRFRPHQSDS
ncbi:MAG: efflux RND transporter permease subunit [Cyanosarcina radialis HA8281-LM2]|jgi:HAE1 family hydrophobic/amphiphilic exporter-1|nr:efflux RND transporter permease subunit [Cyanosarcina radialis HA8281-LM2]